MSQDYETQNKNPSASRGGSGPGRVAAEDPLVELARIVHKNKQSGANVSSGRVGSTDYFAGLEDVSPGDEAAPGAGTDRRDPSFAPVQSPADTLSRASAAPASQVDAQTNPHAGNQTGANQLQTGTRDFAATALGGRDLRSGSQTGLETPRAEAPQAPATPSSSPWPEPQAPRVSAASPAGDRRDRADADAGPEGPAVDRPAASLPLDLEQNLTAELEDELIGVLRRSVDDVAPDRTAQVQPDSRPDDVSLRAEETRVPPVPRQAPGISAPEPVRDQASASVSAGYPVSFGAAAQGEGTRDFSVDFEPVTSAPQAPRYDIETPRSDTADSGDAQAFAVQPQRPRIDENDFFAALNPHGAIGAADDDDGAARTESGDGDPAGIDALFADLEFPPSNRRDAPQPAPEAETIDDSADDAVSAADIDDMTWPAAAAAVPQGETDETPPPPEGYDLDAVARAMQESDPSLTGAGVLPPHSRAEHQAVPQAERRSRRGLFVAAGVVGVAVLAGAAMFLVDGDSVTVPSGPPPVIAGLSEPLKVFPDAEDTPANDQSAKLDYSRVDGTDVAGPDRLIRPETPQPAELPPAPAGTLDSSDLAPGTPKRVRTVIVRPDGTFVTEDEPAPTAPAQPAPAAPQTVPGTGVGAQPAPAVQPSVPAQAAETESPAVPEPAAPAAPALLAETENQNADTEAAEATQPVPSVLPRKKPDAPVQVAAAAPARADGPLDLSQSAATSPAPAAPAAPAPVAAAPSSGNTGTIPSGTYIVQVTSQRSAQAASDAYSNLQRRYPAILGTRQAVVVAATVEDRGVFYRARIPSASRDEAISLCESLQAAGGDCFVRRQP